MNTETEKQTQTIPSPPKPFTNPYGHLAANAENQLTVYVDLADKDLIRACRTGAAGTFTTTLALLVKQLCIELRERDITEPSDRDRYESFLAGFRILPDAEVAKLQDSAAGRPVGLPDGPNVNRPVEGKDSGSAKRPAKRTNVARKDKPEKSPSVGQAADNNG